MGQVYRARDPRLNRDVAVKIIAPGISADLIWRQRFEREAVAIAAVKRRLWSVAGLFPDALNWWCEIKHKMAERWADSHYREARRLLRRAARGRRRSESGQNF